MAKLEQSHYDGDSGNNISGSTKIAYISKNFFAQNKRNI